MEDSYDEGILNENTLNKYMKLLRRIILKHKNVFKLYNIRMFFK